MTHERNTIAMARAGLTFILRFPDDQVPEAIDAALKWADDPELPFMRGDAEEICEAIKERIGILN